MITPAPVLTSFQGLGCARFDPQTSAPPKGSVVAVHGLTRQKRDFDFLAADLAQRGWQVFCLDVPGRGDSPRLPPDEYHLMRYAEILAQVLRQGFDAPVHWIGTSMGGLIALTLALRGDAALLRSLTLIDITHKPNAAACARIADYVVEDLPVLPSIDAYMQVLKTNLPLGDVSEEVWRHYAEHQLRRTAQGYVFHFDPALARLTAPALRAGIDITAGLAALTCPLALVAGGKSDLCTAAEVADLQARRPDLALHICPDAGHVPALADAPAQDFIARFIQQHN